MDKVIHFEIPAENTSRAKKFYKDVFGWKINDMPEFDYTILQTSPTDKKGMIKEPGSINGGMMKRSRGFNWPTVVMGVKDIDKSVELVEKHGGKLFAKKTPVGEMGFTAYVKDTEGNIIGLWENAKGM